jgi:hypothetical protein
MASDDPIDVVGVLRDHLQEIAAALDWSLGHFQALDLADRYRGGHPTVRTSRATALVERAQAHVLGYLAEPEDDDEHH